MAQKKKRLKITPGGSSSTLRLYIRILKELNLYTIYKVSRVASRPGQPIFDNKLAIRSYCFSEFIDISFSWITTGYEKLWATVNDITFDWNNTYFKDLLKKEDNDRFLNLKSCISNILKN